MPQVITPPLGGIQLCRNLSTGGPIKILAGQGDPNLAASDSSAGDLAGSAIGSLFLRMDGASTTSVLYVKTGATTVSAPTGTWTNK